MAKMQKRYDRWTLREQLKLQANRHGNIKSMHPQVRRQLQREKY